MAIPIPSTDDSRLDMTPMIDIVFQMILFFLLNMRFKADPHRIDAMLPRNAGLESTVSFLPPTPTIRVDVHPRETAEGVRAGVRLRLVGGRVFDLPPPSHEEAVEEARQSVRDALSAEIASLHAATGFPGEIDVPASRAGAVAHADAVLVLDAFAGANVLEVKFRGAARPR
jgi:biopolymer transport protein ExbD